MALIRGVNSLFPCPRCLVPGDKQGDISFRAPLRTATDTQATIQEARGKTQVGLAEETLKAAGLRDVDVRLRSYRSYFALLLTISLTECVLEDQKLGSTRHVIFRLSSYFPRWTVSTPSLGPP